MKWEIKNKIKNKNEEVDIENVVSSLLTNRGITTKFEREVFLNPILERVTVDSVGIDRKQLKKSIERIEQAIEKKEQIVVFGDYDVDGICGSAILWETLHELTLHVLPYIPHRVDEGYGLSVVGIKNVIEKMDPKLIITVDNGIVANEAVDFAKSQGIDVIITDHHLPHEDEKHVLPDAFAIVHTTKLCGAGVAWLLSKELQGTREKVSKKDDHLALAAMATIADMVPLTGANRAIVKNGMPLLRQTRRLGLLALFKEAGIEQQGIETYHVGHMIAPRLNASGRMESAMDSLRLLCTRSATRAKELAKSLEETNKARQQEMFLAAEHAIGQIANRKSQIAKLLFISHESYQQGVIGLVDGKLVEKYYRPAIVVSIGETHSKASVRSIKGFNIIEFLRLHAEYFVNVGGHPMAAGFTIETANVKVLQDILEKAAEETLADEHLKKSLSVDCEFPLEVIDQELFGAIAQLAPFGIGNPEPVFASQGVVEDMRAIGQGGKHLKLNLKSQNSNLKFEAVAFGMGERIGELKIGETINIAYVIDENTWNGKTSLQLKIKDFRTGDELD